jgi:hypothetical protein
MAHSGGIEKMITHQISSNWPANATTFNQHPRTLTPIARHKFNPVLHLLCPPPREEMSVKKRSALMAARHLFLNQRLPPPTNKISGF